MWFSVPVNCNTSRFKVLTLNFTAPFKPISRKYSDTLKPTCLALFSICIPSKKEHFTESVAIALRLLAACRLCLFLAFKASLNPFLS